MAHCLIRISTRKLYFFVLLLSTTGQAEGVSVVSRLQTGKPWADPEIVSSHSFTHRLIQWEDFGYEVYHLTP
jgi:hypothetical protein